MINSKKKGFTIVELVIVIAVIAVLAAVLIPTFSNLVKKANISADQQAVVQMNKLLAMGESVNDLPENTDDVVEVLIENGYTSDLTTYYSNYQLAWVKEKNVVVLIENNAIVFPEQYIGMTFETIRPMAQDITDIKESLASGNTVFVSDDIIADTADDLHFKTEGNYALNLNGNTVLTNMPNTVKGYNDGLVVNEKANVVISNGTIEGGNNVSQVVAVYDEATLEIKDSIITGGNKIAVLAEDGGTITISDSKVFGIGTNPIQNYGGTLTLNNVTVAQSGESDGQYYYNSAILIANLYETIDDVNYLTGTQSKTTINGGSYSGKNTIFVVATGGDVIINDGKFIGTDYVINAGFADSYDTNSPEYSSVVTINGGVFNGNIKISPATELEINGGIFSCGKLVIDSTTYTDADAIAEQFAKFVKAGVTVTLNGQKIVGTR